MRKQLSEFSERELRADLAYRARRIGKTGNPIFFTTKEIRRELAVRDFFGQFAPVENEEPHFDDVREENEDALFGMR